MPNVVLDGDKITHDMIVRGLTMRDLADRADVSVQSVRRAMSGEPVRASIAVKIVRALTAVKPLKAVEEFLTDQPAS